MKGKDYILNIENSERRYIPTEIRAKEDSRYIEGYAVVFNKDSENLGGFIERVDPSALDDVLNDDTVALLNHDQNFVLARNGITLKLSKDKTGIKYGFDAPNTTAGNDLLENVRLGNISKSSFAFTVEKDSWEVKDDGPDVRTILKVKRLYDVSPVTYPAYPDTTVAARSHENELNKVDNSTGYKTNIKRKKLQLKNK